MAETTFQPKTPDYADRVRENFAKQGIMAHLGARLGRVEPGFCEIVLPYAQGVSQQHGYFHAGAFGVIADSAGGYAALTLMPAGHDVLGVEYKINLMNPGQGEALIARAQVIKPGRTLTICTAEVFATKDGAEKLCAIAQLTMIGVAG